MRIAIVTYNLKWVGGGQRLTYELAQEIVKRGHSLVIYVPDAEYSEIAYPDLQKGLSIRTVPVPKGYLWSPQSKLLAMRLVYKVIKERWLNSTGKRMAQALLADGDNFDIINVHDFAYKVAYYYKKRGGKAKVVGQGNDPAYHYLPHPESYIYDRLSYYFNKLKDYPERKFFRALDATAVLDVYGKEWYETRGVPRAEVVHHGTDFNAFYAPVKDVSEKFKQKKVQLMGLGILNPYRGYASLIETVRILREWGYDATAKIVCRDYWKRPLWRENLLSRIREGHLEQYVSINFDGVSDAELKKLYAESDIFSYLLYLPAPRNGFGFSSSIPEAAASGIPAMTWTTTTSLEAFKDGESIIAAEPLHAEQLAAKVKELVDNPEKYRAMAFAAQKLVQEELNWQKFTEGIVRLFSETQNTR
ncbi:MAG: glycosyltransferase family 4 protein [Patescibacteria group bacterium]|nr:glycosyltransferase family 4 protein [Patescibacteria group bacterium]